MKRHISFLVAICILSLGQQAFADKTAKKAGDHLLKPVSAQFDQLKQRLVGSWEGMKNPSPMEGPEAKKKKIRVRPGSSSSGV